MFLQCQKLEQFAMPETCENWLGLVNSCVYYTYQTREMCHNISIYAKNE